jgi:3-deoxy-D-manno-octulosonic-acid transferase
MEEVTNLVVKNNLEVKVASKGEVIGENTDFYLYDKMGGLSVFFELSGVVFVAGSLKPGIGGHTPAECIKYGCCVITGPYVDNNKMLFKDLLDDGACIILKDNKPMTLGKTVGDLLRNDGLRNSIINESYAKSIKSSSYLGEVVDKILNMAV